MVTMDGKIFYAFLEERNINETSLSLKFDAIAREEHGFMKSIYEISEINTFTINLRVDFREGEYKAIKNLESNRWYQLTIADNAKYYAELISGEMLTIEAVSVKSIKPLKRKDESDFLKTYSLNRLVQSDIGEIRKVIDAKCQSPFTIRVINVGQGNAIAATNITGWDFSDAFYIDIGGGVGNNTDENIKPRFNPEPGAFVILTHWDQDHWISAKRYDVLNELIWIVPNQSPLGVSHIKIASRLHKLNKLLIWPDTVKMINADILDIHKLPKSKDRNNSGLVVVSKNENNIHRCNFKCFNQSAENEKNTLITGDARYSKCEFISRYNIDALIIPHHGGKSSAKNLPKSNGNGVAILSCGLGNSYGHPDINTIDRHKNKGWKIRDVYYEDLFILSADFSCCENFDASCEVHNHMLFIKLFGIYSFEFLN